MCEREEQIPETVRPSTVLPTVLVRVITGYGAFGFAESVENVARRSTRAFGFRPVVPGVRARRATPSARAPSSKRWRARRAATTSLRSAMSDTGVASQVPRAKARAAAATRRRGAPALSAPQLAPQVLGEEDNMEIAFSIANCKGAAPQIEIF